jgi:DNA primase
MSLPPTFLDDLRFRVRLTDVIGRKVKLTRAGREWKGCCPFHTEKTPSFYINEDKGFYHCFGCGAHGDVIRYLTEAEGMGFMDAVKDLAAQAGMEVPRETPEAIEKQERAKGLHDIMELATVFFQEQLSSMSGSAARAYIDKRGLSATTVAQFRLGYSPDSRTALRTALLAKGATEEQLVDAGLLIQIEDKQPYDRFRGRLMFPIRDPKGRVIAFGGRILDAGEPKYLNSPDTPLFDKGRQLFNFDQAAAPARKSAEIHVVEGYMDVIALAQVGIETAVAPLGTALTEDQIKLLWRCAPEPLLCFDGDTAGQRAGLRAALRCLPILEPGKSLRFITLPEKEDPDSLVRAKGRAGFESLAPQARTLIDLVWGSELTGADISTPERRALIQSRLIDIARTVANPTIKSLYEQEFRSRLQKIFGGGPRPFVPGKGNRKNFKSALIPASQNMQMLAKRMSTQRNQEALIRTLLLTVIRHPHVLDSHVDFFAYLPVENEELEDLQAAIIDSATQSLTHSDSVLDSDGLRTTLAAHGYGLLIERLEVQDQLKLSFSAANASLLQAMHGFTLVGSWLTQLAAIEDDFESVRSDAADSVTDSVMERQTYLRHERDRIRQEMINYIRAESSSAN